MIARPHLIHAVCGSGKTEILFEPIHKLLTAGKRVCIAAPRVDVVLELEPRLRAAFPSTNLEALYGGAEVKVFDAQLILATTHQLYRFRHAFDAIFVDEADAFPYTAEKTLQHAVRKAAKPGAPIHFVTATPSEKLLSTIQKTGAVSTIYRRYHGHPLPRPRYEPLWNYSKQLSKGKLPKALEVWITKRLKKNEPFLVFFHEIELMMKAELAFRQLDDRIRAVHSAHLTEHNMSKIYDQVNYQGYSQQRFWNEVLRLRTFKWPLSVPNNPYSMQVHLCKLEAELGAMSTIHLVISCCSITVLAMQWIEHVEKSID